MDFTHPKFLSKKNIFNLKGGIRPVSLDDLIHFPSRRTSHYQFRTGLACYLCHWPHGHHTSSSQSPAHRWPQSGTHLSGECEDMRLQQNIRATVSLCNIDMVLCDGFDPFVLYLNYLVMPLPSARWQYAPRASS